MVESSRAILSASIKEKSFELGFDLCGIASSEKLVWNAEIIQSWCERGMNDKMNYLCRDIEKRVDPENILPGSKSLIVTGLNYYTDNLQKHNDVPVVSRYAFGRDYHNLISDKLNELLLFIKKQVPGVEGRICVDSLPLTEKPWAVRAGLGWQGKNSIVINERIGSFFFIGVLIITAGLACDNRFDADKCGTCTICIDRCPTGAINNDRTIDARKCISNLTIENRGPIPPEMLPLVGKRIYGCDICQEVCPWNKHAVPHRNKDLEISEEMAAMSREDWLQLTGEKFKRVFGGTPVERVKYERFRGNIEAVMKE
jgi:epoxyqueuosine reductase